MRKYIPTYENFKFLSYTPIKENKELSKDEDIDMNDTLRRKNQEDEAKINLVKDDIYYIIMQYKANVSLDVDLDKVLEFFEENLITKEPYDFDQSNKFHIVLLKQKIKELKNITKEDVEIFKNREH
jgi:hypothetical protein